MAIHYGLNAYAQSDLQNRLAGATPHQLITLLLEGAQNAILQAKIYFDTGNIARRGEMISKAIKIIDNGLHASLDHRFDPTLSGNLERLYEYMSSRLIKANITNDVSILSEVSGLLMELTIVWKKIDPELRSHDE